MKNNFPITLLICAVIFLSPSCKKKSVAPLSKLPAATQTGANTFGCLINGAAFTPHTKSFLNSAFQANYVYYNGGYNLLVSASNDSNTDYVKGVFLQTTNLAVTEGQTLSLENYNQNGKAFAVYGIFYNLQPPNQYQTTDKVSGQLHITKFDQTRQIISGTFFFDAINGKGETVHITDGRFDMKYTQ
ncbi:hypothetical protein [Mucilaginibacter sp. UR6-11]|uniref:hypothetical protein n=1 Tax=Mucilaginibacter sp. UR6-11 TaxID=1435644 RepID=UPI001E28B2F5|nr:hypothetical protein [Mucilaginibacter sp. UR6-11]MCC8425347.1 hypothetical protein [Mucilaginibacter sp. UR6-11]